MRNIFIIYPKYVSTLRVADHIFIKQNLPKDYVGIVSEKVDGDLYMISVEEGICECVVFYENEVYDGFVVKSSLSNKYNNKFLKEYLHENI